MNIYTYTYTHNKGDRGSPWSAGAVRTDPLLAKTFPPIKERAESYNGPPLLFICGGLLLTLCDILQEVVRLAVEQIADLGDVGPADRLLLP